MIESTITRQEAIKLSGLTSGQLSRLDTNGLIVPTKFGLSSHPAVLYNDRQILELKLFGRLKEISRKEFKLILDTFRQCLDPQQFLSNFLVVFGDRLWVIRPEDLGQKLLEVVNETKGGEFRVIHPIAFDSKERDRPSP